jgi:hypothetical protein
MTGRVAGGPAGARLLVEAGVDLILSGHVHTPFVFALPIGDGLTWSAGAATLSLRERGAPTGFNVIDADDEAIRVVALAWTGSRFEPARTWSLPRRPSARAAIRARGRAPGA